MPHHLLCLRLLTCGVGVDVLVTVLLRLHGHDACLPAAAAVEPRLFSSRFLGLGPTCPSRRAAPEDLGEILRDWSLFGAVCLRLHTLVSSQCVNTMIVTNIPCSAVLCRTRRSHHHASNMLRGSFCSWTFSEEVGLFSQLRVQS